MADEQLKLPQFKEPLGIKAPAPVESGWKPPAPPKRKKAKQEPLFRKD
jgi:hypothetical protein